MASSRSLLEQFRNLAELPGRDRAYLVAAWVALFSTEWRLRTRSLRAVWGSTRTRMREGAWLGRWVPVDPDRAAWLLDVAERYHPLRPRCLRTALALSWLLASDRRESILHIGVARPPSGLAAHAWLEVDGRAVTEIPADVAYLPLHPVRDRT